MKAKSALALLGVGFLLCIIGALLKIMHYPGADTLLLAGLGCEVVGALIFLAKLLGRPQNKDFLNR